MTQGTPQTPPGQGRYQQPSWQPVSAHTNRHQPVHQPAMQQMAGWTPVQPQQPPPRQPVPPQGKPSGWRPVGNKPPSKPGARWVLVVIALAVLVGAGAFGIKALRDNQVRQSIAPYESVYAPNIFINDIPLGGLTPTQAFSKLREEMDQRTKGWNLALTFSGHTYYTLDYSELGIQVTDEELYTLLNDAWLVTRKGDIYERRAAIDALNDTPYKTYTSQKEFQSARLQQVFAQIASYINRAPVDAQLLQFRPDDERPFFFQDEQVGMRLDTEAAIAQVMEMAALGQSGAYEIQPEYLPPKVTRAELESTVKLRTSISTAIDRSSPDNRNHNIRLSFTKFNGMILKPGQVFSFNDVVGPRTLATGFAEALEYAYGELEIGIGGGVCQASTTLYQAAVTAGLSTIKRYPHSGPVDYTQLGQDATVFLSKDRNLDFQFKNTTSGNIYITAHVKNARNSSTRLVCVINMYGQDLGDGVSYKLRSDVVQVLEPPTEREYVNDLTGTYATYTDEEKLKTKAVKGQVIETYLEKYQHGVLVEQPKLLSSDTFRAKAAVYYRGINKRP